MVGKGWVPCSEQLPWAQVGGGQGMEALQLTATSALLWMETFQVGAQDQVKGMGPFLPSTESGQDAFCEAQSGGPFCSDQQDQG
jgi:hypothetical protein